MHRNFTPYNLGLLFQEVAANYAEKPALRFENGYEITYSEIDGLSNRIARIFLEHGARSDDVLCIVNPKNSLGYAAMLACLKLGIIYTNIDPGNPAERLNHVFNIAQPRFIVLLGAHSEFVKDAATETNNHILVLEDLLQDIEPSDSDPLPEVTSITGSSPAYLVFTSGSTGKPKGAVITHDNVISFIRWVQSYFNLETDDILAGINPVYFDNSVFDFYASLFSGATLAPIKQETVEDPAKLVDAVENARCTIWFSVPSLLIYLTSLKILNSERFSDLRLIIFGGEGYPKSELKKLWRLMGDRIRFVNVYGPTECTCICSAYDIKEETFENMEGIPPLGRLSINFDGLILDNNKSVAQGEAGELCLLGPNVGRGYYNMPDQTAQSFVQNPLNDAYIQIMYRTGDIAMYSESDGMLYFVGRKDNQIKHMGYRIELEEIEVALSSMEEIIEAAVVYKRTHATHGHIVAYISSSRELDKEMVYNWLRTRLPNYMIPNRIEILDILPKNANGKIDRYSLTAELN